MHLAPRFTIPDDRYAIVLNANAGRVTPRLVRAIKGIISPERVFLTESQDHSREVLHKCVEDDVKTVFAGGGDGTIVDILNTLNGLRGDAPTLPDVGVLRLGTGNALAHWLGSGRPLNDLRRWRDRMVHRTVALDLVSCDDTLFPFAGLGQDAAVLNDYNALKERWKDQWFWPLMRGVPGYLAAAYLRTVPNYLRRPIPRVRVINLGRPVWRIDPCGREVGDPIPTGDVIYQGAASMLGVATTPFYGAGMRMFPHATQRAGRFQLRVMNLTATQAAVNVVPAWKGTLQHEGLHDFYADRVRVIFDDAMPYQLGGEASGYRRELNFSLTETPLRLVGQA
jgi:diacylglycerol kinase family enzyme